MAFDFSFWNKIRTIYYINNWVYTTNHKRIAVNYFWFVILSGIVGMVLATLIRLEFAYPGVGIFAGDSLQYLTLASAHGVVMIFFMIIPLLSGAFANFLLPTQLGVHDVAFPRLNSAAFWFLPGGLLMLCQLVCVDRRYQRMNCFNIREIQSLLKRRFFTDLMSTRDHRNLLDRTSIGIRFKTNNLSIHNSNILNFYIYGTDKGPKIRIFNFNSLSLNMNKHPIHHFIQKVITYFSEFNYFYFSRLETLNFNKFLLVKNTIISASLSDLNYNLRNLYNIIKKKINWLKRFDGPLDFIKHYYYVAKSMCRSYYYEGVVLYVKFHLWKSETSREIRNTGFFRFVFKNLNDYCESSPYLKYFFKNLFFFPANIKFNEIYSTNFKYIKGLKLSATDSLYSRNPLFNNNKNISEDSVNTTFLIRIKNFMLNLYFFIIETFSLAILDFFFLKIAIFVESISGILLGSNSPKIFNYVYDYIFFKKYNLYSKINNLTDNYFTSKFFINSNNINSIKYSNEESTLNFRYWRFSNPIFKYDYKSGDYFPKLYKEIYTHLFTTFADLGGETRNAMWFISNKYQEIFDINFNNFFNNVKTSINNSFNLKQRGDNKFNGTDTFYNIFFVLSADNAMLNQKWVAFNVLDQKFYRMYNTSSMQQRIYNNWRQLKFTREAWRCKLLAARHQKTLFRRYAHEDGVFWSIERNAKDLIPGWAMITPFSSRTRFTAVGKTDIGLMGVLLVLNSSIISAANFLVTYRYLSTLNNRKMRDARAFFTEGVMVSSWMMVTANPMLVIGIIMLLSDRHWQTSFFDYSGGGDTVLFQHMFWFFGHPEVYIVIIPTFGFTNTMLSYYLKKRVSARASLMYSMYTIAFLGFFVWGHHMYMVGLAHTTRMLFSTLTVMISVPAATKIMHWCVTTVNSSFATELPLLFIFTFIFLFVSGGISGMCVAHTGMDVLFHDTFYVIGHFHVMFAGAAMFASFGAFYFYFPAIFGVKYSRIYAYLHYSYYLLGQLMTVIPMFWLGYAGMPRRVLDYPASMGGWHSIISAGHMLSVAGLMAFFIMIFDSLRQGRTVIRNTFGIGRYNTRLNFYLYEIAKVNNVQQKSFSFYRFFYRNSIKLNNMNYINFEPYETTLISYTFLKNPSSKILLNRGLRKKMCKKNA